LVKNCSSGCLFHESLPTLLIEQLDNLVGEGFKKYGKTSLQKLAKSETLSIFNFAQVFYINLGKHQLIIASIESHPEKVKQQYK